MAMIKSLDKIDIFLRDYLKQMNDLADDGVSSQYKEGLISVVEMANKVAFNAQDVVPSFNAVGDMINDVYALNELATSIDMIREPATSVESFTEKAIELGRKLALLPQKPALLSNKIKQ